MKTIKGFILLFALTVCLVPPAVYAASFTGGVAPGGSFSSGEKTDAAAIVGGVGWFYGAMVATDGTNAVNLNIFDYASVSPTAAKLIPTTVITSSATDRVRLIAPPGGAVRYTAGISVSPSSAGTYKYILYYR